MSLDLPASSQKSPNSEADLFASLGKTAPPPSRKPPPPPVAKSADESAELELQMDDILEVEEIGDFSDVSVEGTEPHAKPPVEAPAPAPVMAQPAPAAPPAPQPAPHAQIVKPGVQPTLESPVMPKTLMGMPPAKLPEPVVSAAPEVPPAPNTSPLPLEQLDDERLAEKTMEIRKDAVAQATAHLADEYEGIGHTEVMVRTPELANAAPPNRQTTQKSPVHVQTPSQPMTVTAQVQRPSWQPHPAAGTQPIRRPSSIAPVAMDPSMPPVHSLPPQRSGMSAGAIAGLVFGAVALIGLVGAGGFAASRALSKENTTALTDESPSTPGISTTTSASPSPSNTNNVSAPAAPAEESAPAAAAPASNPAPSSAGVDVSSLPSAAPKGVTAPAAASPSPATHTTTSAPAKSAKSAPEKTPTPAQTAAASTAKVDPNAPLPPPNAANANAPLPPPNAAPAGAPLPAPAAAAPKSNVGTVHVDANLRVVQVDGAFRRTNDGFVTVQCGPHRIKAGMSERTVDVPCGGAVNF